MAPKHHSERLQAVLSLNQQEQSKSIKHQLCLPFARHLVPYLSLARLWNSFRTCLDLPTHSFLGINLYWIAIHKLTLENIAVWLILWKKMNQCIKDTCTLCSCSSMPPWRRSFFLSTSTGCSLLVFEWEPLLLPPFTERYGYSTQYETDGLYCLASFRPWGFQMLLEKSQQ